MDTISLGSELFGIPLIDGPDFLELLVRFLFNALVAFTIIKGIYYRFHRHKDFLFTFFLFNVIIFFVCALLRNLQLSIGFAFGLFALFGILRYRTEPIPIKEMTYLFVLISIAMINAMFSKRISYAEIIFTNAAIVLAAFVLEKIRLFRPETFKIVRYERIEMLKSENEGVLISDLRARTGLKVHRYDIERIDFMTDTVDMKIYYYE